MQPKTSKVSLTRWAITAFSCVLSLFILQGSPLPAQSPTADIPGQNADAADAAKPNAPVETATQEGQTIGSDYVIGPEDVLKIDVFDVPELTGLMLRVANDGTIAPPLLGHVKASGMTPAELRRQLETLWGKKYLQNPQVSVFVAEFHSMPVSVVGAVDRPGLYPMTGPRNLIEMISEAGGLAKKTSASSGHTVLVTREGGFGNLQLTDGMHLIAQNKLEINLQKLLYSNNSALNIEIKPRDIISVSKADVVYVTGRGVLKPGGFVLEDRENVTVFQALAMAGGVSSNAKKHDARIIRRQADGSRTEIPVDLDKVLKGESPDLTLAANDILFVPDSAEKAALKKGAEAIVGTISGLLIYGRI